MFLTLSSTLVVYLIAAVQTDYGWQFGNALATGPVGSGAWIRESITTLVLPATNDPQTGNLALWPGMGTDGGDLVQALAISLADNSCGAAEGQWCVVASTLETSQEMGDYVAASAGDHVTMHYKYNDDTSKYDQTVSVKGKVVSQISTDSGHAEGWGTAVECQSAACDVVPAHEYLDTVIIMDGSDPNYDQTQGTTGAIGQIVTSDGGKTWTADTISIDSCTFSWMDQCVMSLGTCSRQSFPLRQQSLPTWLISTQDSKSWTKVNLSTTSISHTL